MSRPSKCRCICSMPQVTEFLPQGSPASGGDPVVLQVDEFEVIRLLDYKGFTQEQCAVRMYISRTTVTRMYEEGRRKLAKILVEGRPLRIEGGDVMVCTQPRPECAGETYCCHRQGKEPET